jgi:hypothetical protein
MSVIPQLLLVRYLFQQGQDALAEKGPYSAGLAVSLFQDAIELMAWTIAKEVDAKVSEKAPFESLWDAIKSAPKNASGKELPLKAKVVDVNKARVGFKHYGNLPAESDVSKFEGYASQFLQIACRDFFGFEFAEISLIDLIQHPTAVGHLRAAEKAIASSDAREALSEIAKAYHYLGKPMGTLVPRLGNDLSRALPQFGQAARSVAPGVKALEDHVGAMRDFVVVTALGIPLLDYFRLRLLLPGVAKFGDGSFQVQWIGLRPVDADDAAFGLKFVIRYALASQELLGGLTPADRRLLFGDE